MIDKLLLEHVGLTKILDLAVNLVNFFGWMSTGDHSETLLLLALFYQSNPSCLKVMGWVGWVVWVVAHGILVSAFSHSPHFGPGLNNSTQIGDGGHLVYRENDILERRVLGKNWSHRFPRQPNIFSG